MLQEKGIFVKIFEALVEINELLQSSLMLFEMMNAVGKKFFGVVLTALVVLTSVLVSAVMKNTDGRR